jgi:hypothetical protein
LEDL